MSKKSEAGQKKTPAPPRASSSVLLISPENQVLLLHRVQNSSAFPSAHVFPGGNCDPFHDGEVPSLDSSARHEDGEAYRLAAIRETFEESGIILAKNNGFGRLIEVPDDKREEGRRKVHGKEIDFRKWLAGRGGRANTDGLIPFTRWITPTNIPKRFTTQMYIYFLPLASPNSNSNAVASGITSQGDAVIPPPTHDGGREHTAARFAPPSSWISSAQSNEIILFPPQLFLLSMISQYLPSAENAKPFSRDELLEQRSRLKQFIKTSDPPWGEKVMSPIQIMRSKSDGRNILGLDKPGPDLEGTGRKGDSEHVVLVDFKKEGPRSVEVRLKQEVLAEQRAMKEKL